MTRKDYVLIAAAMRNAQPPLARPNTSPASYAPDYVAWFACIVNLAHSLSIDNERFDTVRFLAACGAEKGATMPEHFTRKREASNV